VLRAQLPGGIVPGQFPTGRATNQSGRALPTTPFVDNGEEQHAIDMGKHWATTGEESAEAH